MILRRPLDLARPPTQDSVYVSQACIGDDDPLARIDVLTFYARDDNDLFARTLDLRVEVCAQGLDAGVAFFPYGPWANRLFSSETGGTGMPSFKGVEATVRLAEGMEVPTLRELVEELRGEG